MVTETAGLGAADIALKEIIEEKMGFEMPEEIKLEALPVKRRKKH